MYHEQHSNTFGLQWHFITGLRTKNYGVNSEKQHGHISKYL